MKAKSVVLMCILLLSTAAYIGLIPSIRADLSATDRGLWHLDETSGTNASDSSGNGNHGVVYGANWALGKSGNALVFDGVDDYVEVPDANSLDITGQLTMEAWIFPRSYGSTSATNKVIVQKGDYRALPTNQNGYYLSLGGNGTYNKIYFALSPNGVAFYAMWSSTVIPLNTWTHVVAVYTGTQMVLYINGVKDNTKAYALGIFANTAPLRIGSFIPGVLNRWFDGTIDEVRVSTGATVLYMSPASVQKTSIDYDTTFPLSVIADNVADLYGFDLEFTWNDTLIGYDSRDTAGLDAIWPSPYYWYEANFTTRLGYLKFAAAKLGGVGYTGSHELFKIIFFVKGHICNSVKETPIVFAAHKLSNSTPSSISHSVDGALYKITGKTPSINLGPASKTCHMSVTRNEYPNPDVTEMFDVTVQITDAEGVMGFDFDIRYDTAHLDFVSLTFDSRWTTNSFTPDETGGKVTGSASAAIGQNDTVPLMTMKLKPTSLHIWKDASIIPWTNDLTSNIYVQAATLTYFGAPSLSYAAGKITVPVIVAYTFSPIKGDMNNDGEVDIFDLIVICAHYDLKATDPGWSTFGVLDLVDLGGVLTLDIFDVIIISSNFGYAYTPA